MATRSQQDPTNQAGLRLKTNRENNRRINRAAKVVLKAWSKITPKRTSRKVITNKSLDFYLYDDNKDQLNDLFLLTLFSMNKELETGEDEHQDDWYLIPFLTRASNNGVMQENSWIEALHAGLAFAPLTDESIFQSDSYKSQLDKNDTANYRLYKDLSNTTSSQINQVITQGVDAGLSKQAIRRKIIERFEVSKSSAKRKVDTEVNKIYNNARLDLVQRYRDGGQSLAVFHISALLATTRPHHAERHGKTYTPEQQKRWWDTGANRINCHCSVRTARINRDGTAKDTALQNRLLEQGKKFFK